MFLLETLQEQLQVVRWSVRADAVAARVAQEDAAIAATAFPMGVGLYSMRHSYATRLNQERVPLKEIQDLLGHANASTTFNSYVHSDTQSKRAALDTLEKVILPKAGRLGIA